MYLCIIVTFTAHQRYTKYTNTKISDSHFFGLATTLVLSERARVWKGEGVEIIILRYVISQWLLSKLRHQTRFIIGTFA